MARKKAQAAIEFMTTYGWALMAILVAIGALSYFDFLNADRYKSVGCNTGTQIQCLEAELRSNGNFRVNLRNNYPVDIRINKVYLRKEGTTFEELIMIPPNEYDGGGPSIDPLELDLIKRGESKIVHFRQQGTTFSYTRGSKQTLDIKIDFGRDIANPPIYNILGTVTVRVVQ